jgi:hypothetical protein
MLALSPTEAATPMRCGRLAVIDPLRRSCFVVTTSTMQQQDTKLLFYIGQRTYADALREFPSGPSGSFYIDSPSDFKPAQSAKERRAMRRILLDTIVPNDRLEARYSYDNLSTNQLKSGVQIRPAGRLWVMKIRSKVRPYFTS